MIEPSLQSNESLNFDKLLERTLLILFFINLRHIPPTLITMPQIHRQHCQRLLSAEPLCQIMKNGILRPRITQRMRTICASKTHTQRLVVPVVHRAFQIRLVFQPVLRLSATSNALSSALRTAPVSRITVSRGRPPLVPKTTVKRVSPRSKAFFHVFNDCALCTASYERNPISRASSSAAASPGSFICAFSST